MPSKGVRVWGEVGITVCVNEDTREFLKVSFGHERIAADSTPTTLKKTEKLIQEYNEEVLERQLKRLQRLLRSGR